MGILPACMSEHGMCAWYVTEEARREYQIPGTVVTESENHHVGAATQTQALWKNNQNP